MSVFQVILLVLSASLIQCQSNTVKDDDGFNYEPVIPVNSEFAVYKFNTEVQDSVLTYQYANLWDFDQDGNNDSLAFIGNGGAHTYFHLEIRLSSTKSWIKYPTFYIDMPYLNDQETVIIDELFPQFVVADFDEDGWPEVYLNLTNSFATIPEYMQQSGVTSKRIIIDYKDNELQIENYKEK